MKQLELLAPAGDIKKLYTALHFGADAVYCASKKFGLRAYASNFTEQELEQVTKDVHNAGKKIYITVNIFADNSDFVELKDFLEFLQDIGVDGIIVSDPGIISFAKKYAPKLHIHISTQANVTNKYSIEFWRDQGADRVVVARELSVDKIKEISDYLGDSIELEAFVHGAMCISYSGRCLLSTYLTGRDSNRGECVQLCRWEYELRNVDRPEIPLGISEDHRGTYILNSKDMNTLPILDKIINAGVTSMKIEGRMKSEYYVGCVVNAYRKRIDDILNNRPYDESLNDELFKVKHRAYTTGFYLGQPEQNYETSQPDNGYNFIASVLGYDESKGMVCVEMRNRFREGEELEIVSNKGLYTFTPEKIYDEEGNRVPDCKLVQQTLYIPTDIKLEKYDILRKKV